jgi:hypothetical protein
MIAMKGCVLNYHVPWTKGMRDKNEEQDMTITESWNEGVYCSPSFVR